MKSPHTPSLPAARVPLPAEPLWFAVGEALVLGTFLVGPACLVAGLASGSWAGALGGLSAMAGFHGLALYGMLRPGSNLVGAVQTTLSPAQAVAGKVWLTLDDGPDPETTPATLDLLREAGVKATFFVIGARAEAYPELITRIVEEGHTLGNHTQHHLQYRFWAAGPVLCERELLLCQVALWRLTRQTTRLFRPPAGLKPLFLHMLTRRHNVRIINWSARGLDGVSTSEAEIWARLEPGLRPGAIILLHEGRPTTLALLRRTLATLRERNLSCLPGEQALDSGPPLN